MIAILIILGVVMLTLFIASSLVIALNKKLTGIGRLIRLITILIFPVLGPVVVLVEILLREIKAGEEKQSTDTISA